VARLAPTLLVAFLLAGTAVAFAVTQGLKLEKSPVFGTKFPKVLGPETPARLRTFRFKLRKADTVTVTVVDAGGQVVRTLVDHESRKRGPVKVTWDGRTDDGAPAPEGSYRLRVRLADRRGTIQIPTTFKLDTTAPTLVVSAPKPPVISPDGDGHVDRAIIRYRTGEAARVFLTVNGRQAVRGKLRTRLSAALDTRGLHLSPGRYVLRLRAEDKAGNLSPPSRPLVVTVRFVDIGARRLVARAGKRFRVPLDTDARTVRWRLAGRSGIGPARSLRLRAPGAPGRYRLFVSVGNHADAALVVVRPAP
jgi:flagellar hook capping protein FlgD